jgi:hypothetical protein
MLKIINSSLLKNNAHWLDEVNDFDQENDEGDYIINDDNLDEYLVDDVEEPPQEPYAQDIEGRPDIEPAPQEEMSLEDYRSEIPTTNQLLTPNAVREHIYSNAQALISDAMENREVIGFDYVNRHGAYAGWRTVEPHYVFVAYTTGNEILVTWDRDINDIRAFIVGNIQPEGVRYERENFEPRSEIMLGAY